MTAAAWTAIAILAAFSMGTLFYLGARLDAMGARLDAMGARLDAMGARLDARLDAQSARTDQIMTILFEHSRLLEGISSRLDAHIGRGTG